LKVEAAAISIAANRDAPRIHESVFSFDSSFFGIAGSWEEREKLFLFLISSRREYALTLQILRYIKK